VQAVSSGVASKAITEHSKSSELASTFITRLAGDLEMTSRVATGLAGHLTSTVITGQPGVNTGLCSVVGAGSLQYNGAGS